MQQEANRNYLFGVILAGGSGSRLWPLSRELYPKHFLNLFGEKSLIQATLKRMEKLIPPQNIIFVTNQRQVADIKMQLDFIERQRNNQATEEIIVEPIGRDTTAAIGLAAFNIYEKNPESVMIVAPSDHLIKNEERLIKLLEYSLKIAVQGYLVTLGVTPSHPEIGYGYIKKGEQINKSGEFTTYEVASFQEKPDAELAKQYLESKEYFWNAGIYIWKTKEILRAIKLYQPELYQVLSEVVKPEISSGEALKIYQQINCPSVDYAISEKSNKMVVIPTGDIGWSDIGHWNEIHEQLPKDEHGNFVGKKVIQMDCENSLIFGDGRVIAAINLKDIIIIDADDALLVCSKNKVQQVKDVFEILKNNGSKESLEPKTVQRPWGWYTTLLRGPGYKIKSFLVNPGRSLSLQMHQRRSEHWVVISGRAEIQRESESFVLGAGESTFIPLGARHRVLNLGQIPLEIIEIQNGDYLEEDDILRIEDDYGRT